MNKSQALYQFWSGFDLPAYDENSVPDDTPFPYITYSEATDSLGNVVQLTASIWDRNNSWERLSLKTDEIAEKIGKNGYHIMSLDGGYVWFVKGIPFAQRMGDPDKTIKRVYLNVQAEFLTRY